MRTVSDEYLAQVQASGRQFGACVRVYGNAAEPDVLWLGDIISIDILRSCSDQLQIGACMSDMLTLETKATALFNGRLKKVEVFYRCTAPVLDWVLMGTFYVDEAVTRNGVTAVKAYDMMSRLDKRVSWVDTSKATAPVFPCKMQSVLNYLCARAGVTTDFVCEDITVEKAPDGYTAQELISFIAASHGRNARFSPSEVLKFPAYEEVGKTVQHGRCYSLDIAGGSGYTVKGILLQRGGDDKIYIDGTASEYDETADGIVTAYDPFATVGIAEYAWNRLGGLNYSAVSLEMPAENILEPGDVFTVEDADGSQKKAIVMEQELSLTCTGGFVEKISCTAESKAQNRSSENRTEAVETAVNSKSSYTTHLVTNAQPLKFDSIERGLLSVDFKVDSADSDVLFSGSQLCSISGAGTVGIVYKVDGAPQDFKPEQLLTAGKHVIAHAFPMALAVGKHNFAVCMLSDGRGFTDVGALRGALSGCISGMKNIAPPNENLVFYYSGLPAGEFSLPAGIVSGSGKKYIDWGDGSAVEESTASAAVTHTYAEGGDYTITIKTDSVKFGGSYKVVAASGFESYLTRVYFPDNAGTIEFSSSTQKLPNLETLVFGTSATKVYWSFGSACNVTSLLLPDTVQNVNFPGFDKTKVVLFVVPQSVTSILNGLVAPMTLRTLERYDSGIAGMSDASGLESLTIGGNAAKTGSYLNAIKLTSVEFPEPSKVTEVTDEAFNGCSSLTEIVLPSTVKTIGRLAFKGCKALKSVNVPAGVTAIEEETFRSCSALAGIDLPGVTQIGEYALAFCTSLVSVGLHEGLTKISQYAFNNCTAMSEITFPSTLTTVGQYAFDGCTAAFSPGTAARIVTVGSYAFQNSGITEFTVYPETVLSGSAFKGCSRLANLEIQEGITYIPSKCFYGTTSLGVVTFPASLLKIENEAFLGSSVTPNFSNGLVSIGARSFESGFAVNMDIPESVTEIGGSAFSGNSMKSITIGGNPNVGSNAFQGCKSLVSANISQLGVIPQSCFSGCSKLAGVSFKGGVRIGYSAFAGCGFTSLNVLSYLAEASAPTTTGGNYDIGGGAFQNCKSLLSVDGYEYKWDVYLKAVYGSKDSDGNWSYQTVYTKLADGIYNYMGATEDNVFSGTALKTAGSYPKDEIPANVTTSDYTERYSVLNWTSSGAPG